MISHPLHHLPCTSCKVSIVAFAWKPVQSPIHSWAKLGGAEKVVRGRQRAWWEFGWRLNFLELAIDQKSQRNWTHVDRNQISLDWLNWNLSLRFCLKHKSKLCFIHSWGVTLLNMSNKVHQQHARVKLFSKLSSQSWKFSRISLTSFLNFNTKRLLSQQNNSRKFESWLINLSLSENSASIACFW